MNDEDNTNEEVNTEEPNLEVPTREEEILKNADKPLDAVKATPAKPAVPDADPMDRKLFVPVTREVAAMQLPNGCLIKFENDTTFVPGIKVVPAADKPAPKGRGFAPL